MDVVERVSQGVIIEVAGVDGGAEEQFGVLLGDEFLHLVEGTPARQGVSNHAGDEGSHVNVGAARDAFVDEINEAKAVAHPGYCGDVVDSQHGGVIDELLCNRGGLYYGEE